MAFQEIEESNIIQENLYMVLSIAIRKNSYILARRALDKYDTMKSIFGREYFLLIQALRRFRKRIVKLFLLNDFKVNCASKTNFYHTPLYYAVAFGDYEMVSILLDRGALINKTDISNETSLILAFRLKKYDLVKLMLSKYFAQNKEGHSSSSYSFNPKTANKCMVKNHYIAYYIACLTNDEEAITKFNNHLELFNCDELKKRKLFDKLRNNHTWFKDNCKLHFAVENGMVELVYILLLSGEDITEKNGNGMTALHLAYLKSHTNPIISPEEYSVIIDLILDSHHETSENCTNEQGLSHFHIACERNNLNAVKKFLKDKVDLEKAVYLESPVLKGNTPLHCAAQAANLDVIKLLLQENADVNAFRPDGLTPIHMIFIHYKNTYHLKKYNEKFKDILEIILLNEKNLTPKVNYKGLSYLHIACSMNNETVVDTLIAQGMDVNQIIKLNSEVLPGFTPLHCAVWFQNLNMVKLLLRYNVDVNIKNADGLTPIHLAWLKNSHSVEIDVNSVDNLKVYNVYNIINVNDINDMIINSSIIDVLLLELNDHLINSVDKKRGISHFHIACTRNNVNVIQNFIKSQNFPYSIINQKTFLNSLCVLSLATPLHSAVKFNQVNAVELLLQHGADVNAVNENGSTALLEACQFSYFKIYELMLGTIIDMENFEGSDASLEEFLTTIEINNGWKKNRDDNLKIIDLLLRHGSDVNTKDRFCEPLLSKMFDSEKFFIIFDRLTENLRKSKLIKFRTFDVIRQIIQEEFKIRRKEIIKVLLSSNVDTNAVDYKKNTILHLLANDPSMDYDLFKIFKLLLSKGANINAKNVNGLTPLHVAVRNRNLEIEFLKLLIKHDADVNSPDEDGKTPLHLLFKNLWSQSKIEQIIDTLVSAGADINARDKSRLTPLYAACLSNNKDAVSKLFDCGADINIEYTKNKTIIHYLSDYIPNFFEHTHQIYHILREQVIKLYAIGTLSKNLEKIFSRQFENISDLEERSTADGFVRYGGVSNVFYRKCKNELTKMKKSAIKSYTSLYDILFKSSNQMVIYLNNDNFMKIVSNKNLDEEFPIYGYLLILQFKKGLNRKTLLNPAINGLYKLTQKNLPDLCIETILKFLDDHDLKHLSQCI